MMILGAGLMVLMMVGMFVGHEFIMKHDDAHTKDSAHTAMTRDPAPGEKWQGCPWPWGENGSLSAQPNGRGGRIGL